MTYGIQLELLFDVQVQAALATPETPSIKSLWTTVESRLTALPDEAQLQLGAWAIAQLAELVEAKADQLLEEWEQRYRTPLVNEPVLSPDLLVGVLRQSMQLNLTDAVQAYTPLPRPFPSSPREPIQSVVGEIDKADLLHLLEDTAESYIDAIAVAHAEDVSGWIEAIARYVERHRHVIGAPISLVELQQSLNCSLVEVWLGLLLGELGNLERQDEDFYSLNGLYLVPEA